MCWSSLGFNNDSRGGGVVRRGALDSIWCPNTNLTALSRTESTRAGLGTYPSPITIEICLFSRIEQFFTLPNPRSLFLIEGASHLRWQSFDPQPSQNKLAVRSKLPLVRSNNLTVRFLRVCCSIFIFVLFFTVRVVPWLCFLFCFLLLKPHVGIYPFNWHKLVMSSIKKGINK